MGLTGTVNRGDGEEGTSQSHSGVHVIQRAEGGKKEKSEGMNDRPRLKAEKGNEERRKEEVSSAWY